MNRSEPTKTRTAAAAPIEVPNAFIGKAMAPSRAELDGVLGASAAWWNEIVRELEQDGISGEEWKGVLPKKYGWTLRLKQKSRNIVYLSPCAGCFRVGFVLSDRAMEAAEKSALPKSVKAALAQAPKYPEGNGVRLTVRSARDLPAVRKLASIKMAS
jgi:hypothetical protein